MQNAFERLRGKHIVVGVSGSIACYRAPDVIRRLRDMGASVRVAPTTAASAFVTPKLFEAISGMPVLSTSLDVEHGKIPHVIDGHRADVVAVVPASADICAKMAHGFADEAILSLLLSSTAPVVVAPAMETHMWNHDATQANMATLTARGVRIVGPTSGALASGKSGAGRLADVDDVVEAIVAACVPQTLAGKRVVVTAGPTVEDIDPARYLTNRSSGKMGTLVAREAALRGADVHVVHGPLKTPVAKTPGMTLHAVRSAADMKQAVAQLLVHRTDIGIFAAAVADYTPTSPANRKLKKSDGVLSSLALTETTDILAVTAHSKQRPTVLVGFAAETHDVERYAVEKLDKKRCDAIVGNDVSEAGAGFDVDTNRVFIATHDASTRRWLSRMSKEETAVHIVDEVQRLLRMAFV
jgi:phosphopantothenoylcysteine decarboxylase / phosphopantothenate---cysteine ligase